MCLNFEDNNFTTVSILLVSSKINMKHIALRSLISESLLFYFLKQIYGHFNEINLCGN